MRTEASRRIQQVLWAVSVTAVVATVVHCAAEPKPDITGSSRRDAGLGEFDWDTASREGTEPGPGDGGEKDVLAHDDVGSYDTTLFKDADICSYSGQPDAGALDGGYVNCAPADLATDRRCELVIGFRNMANSTIYLVAA